MSNLTVVGAILNAWKTASSVVQGTSSFCFFAALGQRIGLEERRARIAKKAVRVKRKKTAMICNGEDVVHLVESKVYVALPESDRIRLETDYEALRGNIFPEEYAIGTDPSVDLGDCRLWADEPKVRVQEIRFLTVVFDPFAESQHLTDIGTVFDIEPQRETIRSGR